MAAMVGRSVLISRSFLVPNILARAASIIRKFSFYFWLGGRNVSGTRPAGSRHEGLGRAERRTAGLFFAGGEITEMRSAGGAERDRETAGKAGREWFGGRPCGADDIRSGRGRIALTYGTEDGSATEQ